MTSNVTLITGGSRSGKSSYAEDLYKDREDVLYIATAIVTDKEMKDRINRHRKRRNKSWETAEAYKDLSQVIALSSCGYILLDCVTVMVTNLMFDLGEDIENMSWEEISALEESIVNEFELIVKEVRCQGKEIVIVTGEVGSGLISEYKFSRVFRDIAGTVNQKLAQLSDQVYLISCGLPLKLK